MSTPIETIISGLQMNDESLTEAGFAWRERDGVRILVSLALEQHGFANGFSTRLGGVSAFPHADLNLAGYSEDTAVNIEENRRRFLGLFSRDYSLATVWQAHTGLVKKVTAPEQVAETNEKADAVVSNLKGVLAGVKTADCVPVLLGDPVTRSFAAVHAGWRGTLASIVVKALEAMSETFGSRSENIVAAIGPAAGCELYEIGTDVIEAFERDFAHASRYLSPTRDGHALIDLKSVNRDQLTNSGVSAENISVSTLCTMSRTDLFFSYRIEKQKFGKTGRLMSVIGLL
jgi:polyphenol oxidase